jgi:hypothetical protein
MIYEVNSLEKYRLCFRLAAVIPNVDLLDQGDPNQDAAFAQFSH